MNYFELYELPIQFNPDQNEIKRKFYALSKKYHPDFYINESIEKQDEVLERSTLNNKAFQVLKDSQKRLHYILTLKGQLTEGENYTLPQDFLMEMMEVNEALMELEFDQDEEKSNVVRNEVAQIEKSLLSQLEALTTSYDNNDGPDSESLLKSIKDLYYRNKYLIRIKEKM